MCHIPTVKKKVHMTLFYSCGFLQISSNKVNLLRTHSINTSIRYEEYNIFMKITKERLNILLEEQAPSLIQNFVS